MCWAEVRKLLLLASAVAVGGCAPNASVDQIVGPEPGMLPFPTPRTFDAPGTVFRVRPDGIRTTIIAGTDFQGLQIDTASEQLAIAASGSRASLGAMADFLGIGLGPSASREDTVRISVSGARREFTTERRIRDVVVAELDSADFAGPGRLYVILETILADSVDIWVGASRSFLVSQGQSGAIASDSTGTSWRANSSRELEVRFRQPHRVFYKALAIARSGLQLEPGRAVPVVLVPVDEPLVWLEAPSGGSIRR